MASKHFLRGILIGLLLVAFGTWISESKGQQTVVTMPDGCVVHAVTCNTVGTPPPVVVPPPTQPPAGGTAIPWVVNGNSRTFAHNVHSGDFRTFWFRTPASVDNHAFASAAYSGFQDAFKDTQVKDGSGKVLAQSKGQSPSFQFGAGTHTPPPIFGPPSIVDLLLNTVYYVTVSTPTCPGVNACDYYIDMNNVGD